MNLTICPKCGKDQGAPAAECRGCGIVFAKYQASRLAPAEDPGSFQLYRAPAEPKKKRRWLRVLVALAATAALVGFIGLQLVFAKVRGLDSYAAAADLATTHPSVVRTLGEPVEVARTFAFALQTNVDPGGAREGAGTFALPVSGPGGEGTVAVDVRLVDGTWQVADAFFAPDGGAQQLLVQQGLVVGGDLAEARVEATRPEGLSAEQLLKGDYDTRGSTDPDLPPPPELPPELQGRAPPPDPSTPRVDCAYPGSRADYVTTIKPSEMRDEVMRSSGCVTLVMIWGAWCPSCQQHYPYAVSLAEYYRDDGLAFHSFSTDQNPALLERYLESQSTRTGTHRLQLDPDKKGTISAGVSDFGGTYDGKVPFFVLLDDRNNVVAQGRSWERLEREIKDRLL